MSTRTLQPHCAAPGPLDAAAGRPHTLPVPETTPENFTAEDLDLSLGAGSDPLVPVQPVEPRTGRRLLNRPPLSADALDAEVTNRRAMRPRRAA